MTDEAKAIAGRLRQVTSVLFDDYGDGTHAVEDYALAGKAADLIETQAREIERLREELMQIEVDAMEYYNDWMEHGCEQVEATRFAFDLGQYARAALEGDSHDQ